MVDVRAEIERVSAEVGLDPLLVEAVAMQESGLRPSAFRHEPGFYLRYLKKNPEYKGLDPMRVSSSYGLLQVMYPTAVDYGFTGDPEELFLLPVNLHYGVKVLKDLLQRFKGDTTLALAAYNGGPGNAHAKIPLEYARKVLLRHAVLRETRNPGAHRPTHA